MLCKVDTRKNIAEQIQADASKVMEEVLTGHGAMNSVEDFSVKGQEFHGTYQNKLRHKDDLAQIKEDMGKPQKKYFFMSRRRSK